MPQLEKPLITGLRPQELAELLGEPTAPSQARAHALLKWLYEGEEKTALPERLEGISWRALDRLRDAVAFPEVREVARQVASDGTIKLLLDAGGAPLETVMIPGSGRTTICVSSQSGCSRDCNFCATALMGFRRNLWAGEIVAQLVKARAVAPPDRPVRNVVFMGMGEPLDNLDEVVRAVDVMCAAGGLGLSPRHVTVSTSGVLPRMEKFVTMSPANLALSLNGTSAEQRLEVMPIEKRWAMPELLDFMRRHGDDRRFFVEYILMGDFNDGPDDATRLIDVLAGLNVRVNLIPFNPHPGARFKRPSPERVQAFFERIQGAGIRTLVRQSRGDDIAAACGQLHRATAEEAAAAV